MRPGLALLFALLPLTAQAAVIGGPLLRDGIEIVPGLENGIQFDRAPVSLAPDSIFLTADVRAAADNPHGFTGFIPYLSISFTLTKDDQPTYKKSGLLYPAASKSGPRYMGVAEMAGPGTYHLTYIVSPPSAHGMYRLTGKDNGVPDWWKPITAKWDFTYPNNANHANPNTVSAK
jgi:periplasmic iron binding protein